MVCARAPERQRGKRQAQEQGERGVRTLRRFEGPTGPEGSAPALEAIQEWCATQSRANRSHLSSNFEWENWRNSSSPPVHGWARVLNRAEIERRQVVRAGVDGFFK